VGWREALWIVSDRRACGVRPADDTQTLPVHSGQRRRAVVPPSICSLRPVLEWPYAQDFQFVAGALRLGHGSVANGSHPQER